MDKELLTKLQKIYFSTNHETLFSRFNFNQMMHNKATKHALNSLKSILSNMGIEPSQKTSTDKLMDDDPNNVLNDSLPFEEKIATIYLRLSEVIGRKKFNNLLGKTNSDNYELIEDEILKTIGLDNMDLKRFSPTVLTHILMQPTGVIREIYEKNKDNILQMLYMSNDSIDFTEIESIDFYNNPDKISSKDISFEIGSCFSDLLSVYSIDDLLKNSPQISKDIQSGLTKKLASKAKRSIMDTFYIENQETLREIIEASSVPFTEETFEIIEHASEYKKQIELLAKSGRFKGEELEKLHEMLECFNNLYIPRNFFDKRVFSTIEDPKEVFGNLLKYISKELKADTSGEKSKLPFPERLNEYVMTYEMLYREDIINNITEVKPEQQQQIELEANNQKYKFDGIVINSLEKLGNPMVHMFNNNYIPSEFSIYRYVSIKILEEEILKNSKTKNEMKTLIESLAELIETKQMWQPSSKSNVTNYVEELKSVTNRNSEDIESHILRYMDIINSSAHINQLNLGSKIVEEKVSELIENDELKKHFFSEEEPHLSVQILRSRKDDIGSLASNSTALIFDKNGMDSEAIILSANVNLETNNYTHLAMIEEHKTPVQETSASYEALKNDVVNSSRVRRDNNEQVLNRQAVRPSGLMFICSRENFNEKDFLNALNTAKNTGIPFVFVDKDSILHEIEQLNKHKDKEINER